jgi:hypothetical protein
MNSPNRPHRTLAAAISVVRAVFIASLVGLIAKHTSTTNVNLYCLCWQATIT